MKLNFPNQRGSRRQSAHPDFSGFTSAATKVSRPNSQASTFNPQPSQSGIALIITLILLAVVLIMAVAFLAISTREQGSVVTSTDTATARLAAGSALAYAEAQIIANVYSTTNPNPYNFGLLVSTNYINANAFTNGSSNPLNVNYYDSSGNLLTGGNLEQNIANLFYLPRPPVFIVTNQATGSSDFRFYLDLNRNGKFEDTRVDVPDVNSLGVTNGFISAVGDPQWVGILERPDTTHGPNNKFLSRYAFIAVPAGNALDLNYIHNQARRSNQTVVGDDEYLRNQGVGSWEINLAAFLADLNTNEWFQNPATLVSYYDYEPTFAGGPISRYQAFDDALALLNYRYGGTYNNLAWVQNLFNLNGQAAFQNNIDFYSDGPLMTTPAGISTSGQLLNIPWAGADNTNHFFSLESDLFDPIKVSPGFVGRLSNAGANNSTYDRYTFYRMLSQLGTDSDPEENKINLNYQNAVVNYDANGIATNITIVPNMETNFIPWHPVDFFTVAADRMLKLYTTTWFKENPTNYLATYYGITNYTYSYNLDGNLLVNDPNGLGLTNVPYYGLTNAVPDFGLVASPGVTNLIPVYVNGQFLYSPAVNRLLQLAANIYDATTNKTFALGYDFPSVFRPIFDVVGPNIYIAGYSEVLRSDETDQPLSTPYILGNGLVLSGLITSGQGIHVGASAINVFGVPTIIGAKKGFPNFNQFAIQNTFQITRKIQLTRASTNAPLSSYKLNQMYTIGSASQSGMADQLGVECWNSYTANYTRSTDIYVTNYLTMVLTNDEGFITNATFPVSGSTNISAWPGSGSSASFVFPMPLTNVALIPPNSVYRFLPYPHFEVDTNPLVGLPYETTVAGYPQPNWWLIVTNNLQVVMVDHATGRIIDYVQLTGPNSSRYLSGELEDPAINNYSKGAPSSFWDTNIVSSGIIPPTLLPEGVENQLIDSKYATNGWTSADAMGFKNFIHQGISTNQFGTNLEQDVYEPPATLYQYITLQANDPLVHYMGADLFDSANTTNATTTAKSPLISTTAPNERYQPWGRLGQMSTPAGIVDQNSVNLAFKDPLVWSSDYWDFPTNKFPTVGWLGRVHRGTPWQTVYLKAFNVLNETNVTGTAIGLNTWANWTGNFNIFDTVNAAPGQDVLLFDLFTTAPNDNATRGQLSVNVDANTNDLSAGLAAWSALFSGVMVLSNNVSDSIMNLASSTLISYEARDAKLPPSFPFTAFSYTNFPVNPAGQNGLNSFLGQMVTNINYTRSHFTNIDGTVGTFEHVGDILHVPQLTEQSPFLHWNNDGVADVPQQQLGISDEMYEWLPQQAMSLLRVDDAPRYVIYCYGQTLKPAPGGIVTSGSFFGMVTNYQITAETAVRAVVRVDGVTDPVDGTPLKPPQAHPHIVIESFNILPPD